uniref:Uncharacterized protein n=1 Tax=Ditylenchus dipsaci TaxID=166011 RepID=A0A915DUE8_9BILA
MAGNQRHRRQVAAGGARRRHVEEVDTDDSGIETMMTASIAPSEPLLSGRRRSVRVDDVLWMVCFIFTLIFFDIPNTLLFNQKVLPFYLQCALANHKGWALSHATFIRVAMAFCWFFTAISFCLATWQVYQIWSIYICLVSTMTFLACIAII